eukprot:g18592.t1
MAQSSPGEESCQSQLNEEDWKGTFEDLDFLEDCLEGFLDDAQALSYEKLLPVPTDWDNVLVEQEMDMGRIQRLTSVCMDTPSLPTDTGYRRLPLVYGERKALVCSLAGPKRNARSKVKTTQEEESSSESELEAEETSEASDQELPLVPYTEVIEETEEDRPNRNHLELLLQSQVSTSKELATATHQADHDVRATGLALPRDLHQPGREDARIKEASERVAERICETTTFLRTSSVGSGGLALVSKPLEVRDNVCPDAPNAYGVTFDVWMQEVDAQKHRDGLAIGFTAEARDACCHQIAAASKGQITCSKEINKNWLFCIPIQVGPATEYARGLRHWFAFIILLQVAEGVCQLVLKTALLNALYMADMNITYVCLWGLTSLFLGVMAIISNLIPVITGVLSLDVVGLVLAISGPLIYALAGAFARRAASSTPTAPAPLVRQAMALRSQTTSSRADVRGEGFAARASEAASCLVGYSGRWVAPGQRELVQGAYNPAALKRGDVLTAVIAGAPASLMRILVNGKVVAQKPLSFTGLDPAKPLWGLIDIEGSCVKVRLGASLLN